ncbi:hypothetical protein N7516_000598 [Penicillium verrucosum]|uniref:uncharacterized protein n=1 Tax=Penicillium verrucosum TaxID=60171 RepID=UPI00254521EE|nr:uncharacterized protein N7516_000598 [Penicillium verrucosum]KAJ5940430.1 hypothetical protein N7516_000598 [Penicillium verrucosum]
MLQDWEPHSPHRLGASNPHREANDAPDKRYSKHLPSSTHSPHREANDAPDKRCSKHLPSGTHSPHREANDAPELGADICPLVLIPHTTFHSPHREASDAPDKRCSKHLPSGTHSPHREANDALGLGASNPHREANDAPGLGADSIGTRSPDCSRNSNWKREEAGKGPISNQRKNAGQSSAGAFHKMTQDKNWQPF